LNHSVDNYKLSNIVSYIVAIQILDTGANKKCFANVNDNKLNTIMKVTNTHNHVEYNKQAMTR
jgi:hypothetical protein